MNFKTKLNILPGITLPEYPPVISLSSSGAGSESQPGAMGVYYKLPGLPFWENSGNKNIQLLYDGNIID